MIDRAAAVLLVALILLGSAGCGRYGAPVRRPYPRPEAGAPATVAAEPGEPGEPGKENDEEAATGP